MSSDSDLGPLDYAVVKFGSTSLPSSMAGYSVASNSGGPPKTPRQRPPSLWSTRMRSRPWLPRRSRLRHPPLRLWTSEPPR